MSQSNLNRSDSKSSAIEISIIILLIIIAIVIFRQQFHFNPAVTALLAKVTLPERDLNRSDNTGNNDSFNQHFDNKDSLPDQRKPEDFKPIVRLVKPLVPLTPPESFNAETLSDKINGKAELYLPAGFKSLVCQRFKISTDYTSNSIDDTKSSSVDSTNLNSSKIDIYSKLWFELFLYDMALPENAFAVFSRQRRDDAAPVLIAQYAYQTDNALFFVHGNFYIEMIASSNSEDALKYMIELGKAFIEDRAELSPKKMDIPELFPIQGLDNDSITLTASDAFGFDKFDNIYTANYTVNGSDPTKNSVTLTAFISKRNSSEEAAKLALDYTEFLVSFGGNRIDSNIDGFYCVEIMDTIELLFSSGQYLAGVRDSGNLEISKNLAHQIKAKINID